MAHSYLPAFFSRRVIQGFVSHYTAGRGNYSIAVVGASGKIALFFTYHKRMHVYRYAIAYIGEKGYVLLIVMIHERYCYWAFPIEVSSLNIPGFV